MLLSSQSKLALLRDAADRRTLLWSLGMFPLLPVCALLRPQLAPYLLPVALYFGFCSGVLAHYHNHRGVFRRDTPNQLYSVWLSVFYGFPLFGWIPTHNQNHHKFVNGPGDVTRTDRDGRGDTLWHALSYPTRSSKCQLPLVLGYLRKAWRRGAAKRYWLLAQTLAVPVVHGAIAAACVHFHGWALGLLGYGGLVLLPALFASWSMMFINYVQHVGCDPSSADRHSRDFVGSWQNWFVFDAGLHSVHHEQPGAHWSQYRALHEQRKGGLDPALCERDVLTFVWRHYVARVWQAPRLRHTSAVVE